ncbi:uncharacterized protein LOC111408250 isoform X2 [Olea europaea var. sylvestris]|uniref:uncharacterized protein LOC111408250 isoform X2 n=1 Tax=Olea europaea var. sylvestris TaxID=158386 RepID=UPI000C1D4EAE|nr:uncharacterized protein LOC111408250 isoform X2 [Olea europaea var. sylvestris]
MAKPNGFLHSSVKSPQHPKLYAKQSNGHLSMLKKRLSNDGFWHFGGKLNTLIGSRGATLTCHSTETRNTETEEYVRHYDDCANISSAQAGDEDFIETGKNITSSQGLAEACKFVCEDAKFVNERAKNDIVLLFRLSNSSLVARAREDTEKIDQDVKRRAERLHRVATILKNKAQSRLKYAADKHWSDGALEADLRRADFAAKQRAMEDAFMALEFVKNIHDRMVRKMCRLKNSSVNSSAAAGRITLEKNGKTLDFIEVSADRINAMQEAYWSIASALSEADGIDYTDPEELELLVATLIDLDAMDGKSSVSLLAECSSSPDVNTRRALANALSVAPSMWTLGNAGMGALQRLAEDSNPAIAAAASKTLCELKKQWEIEEGDSWRFMMNPSLLEEEEKNDNTETG